MNLFRFGPAMELRRFIYLSRLSGNIGKTGLRQIMQRSRENNQRRDLTGALLFDGESFVQLLEGRNEDVRAIVALIAADSRHIDFTPVHDQLAADGRRRCASWRNGYIEPEVLDLYRAQALSACGNRADAFEGFLALMAKADVI